MLFHPSLLVFLSLFLSLISLVSCQDLLLAQDQMQTMLDLHNGARQSTIPPAANEAALFWSFSLASGAADFAATCPMASNSRDANVGWGVRPTSVRNTPILLNPIDAFKQWQLGTIYNYNTKACGSGPPSDCGPYLKIVSDQQRLVGCAARTCTFSAAADPNGVPCPGNSCVADVYVCVYSQNIDYAFTPYVSGMQCSNCPGDKPFCSYAITNGLSPTGGLCTDTNGLLRVGQEPSDSVFFGRRSTLLMSYVGIGFGCLLALMVFIYAYKVRSWYVSGETKLLPRRSDGSKYEKVALGDDSSVPMSKMGTNGVSAATSPGGKPPPLPSGKPTVLPPNWQVHKDSQGRPYYYNTVTGASQWTLPV